MPEISSDQMPSLLVGMLKNLVAFDNAVILYYHRNEKPQIIYNDIPPNETERQIDQIRQRGVFDRTFLPRGDGRSGQWLAPLV